MNKLLKYQLKSIGYQGSLTQSQTLTFMQQVSAEYDKIAQDRIYCRKMLDVAKNKITQIHHELDVQRRTHFVQAEKKYHQLIENLQPNYFFYSRNHEGRFISVSDSVSQMLGFTPKEFIHRHAQQFIYGLRCDLESKQLVSEYGYNVPYELNLHGKNERLFHLEVTEYLIYDENNQIAGIEGIVRDITEHISSKNRVSTMLHRDTLTGISNRLHLEVLMEGLILDHHRKKNTFSMIFLDLDHFKHINDTLGHDIGDLLLQTISSTISDSIRENDIFARIGGDEFVIIFKNIEKETLLVMLDKLMKMIQEPWLIHQYHLNISASIGVVQYPQNGTSTVELMKSADIAMYQSKKKGRNTYTFFDKEQNILVHNEMELIQEMPQALEQGEFSLYFQPKVSLSSNNVVAAEALIRWKHPEKGNIGPSVFIPLAENTGFILKLGRWIVEEACKSLEWFNKHVNGKRCKLSINISIRQFQHECIYSLLKRNIEKYDIDAEQLSIEITESIMMDNPDKMALKLTKIKSLGVSISLDDFGTGYSTLSYLSQLSIDELKIDKAFVDDILIEGNKSIVLDTIIAMGQTLNMTVVAEGVEYEHQRAYLQKKGCDIYQGFLFSKAISKEDYLAIL